MKQEDRRKSLLEMIGGAIKERVDYEVTRVIDNILDANTDPTKKRKITLTIELKPSDDRQIITLEATAKSALAPTKPVGTTLAITADRNGEMIIAEVTPQIPGQIDMDGHEQEQPKILKLAALM